jgi:hypothetical protein
MGVVVDAASGANFDSRRSAASRITCVPAACPPEPLGDDHSVRHLPSEAFGKLQPVTDPIAAQLTVKRAGAMGRLPAQSDVVELLTLIERTKVDVRTAVARLRPASSGFGVICPRAGIG